MVLGTALASTVIVAGVTLGYVVGTIVLTGAIIGVQMLLTPAAGLPKQADGSQAIRQPLVARRKGYGRVRRAGSAALYR